jgi:penicillin amidase
MAVGSNGDIAWGFTNSVGDWSDVVIVERTPGNPTMYQTPEGPRAFDVHAETIAVKDGAADTVDVRWTIWGPVIGRDHRDREIALKWVAHDPRVLATDAARIAHARDVAEAMQLAAGAALAAQNLVVGDRDGHIGWTIYGAIPRRVGTFEDSADGAWGDVPTSWASGERRWDGYLGFDEQPRVVDPPDGRLWTANARVVGGEMLRKIGDGGYSDGIRAWLIRDRLRQLDTADELAMFDIQLDNRSVFLDRWRTLFLELLTAKDAAASPLRSEARQLVQTAWSGHAAAESVAYRLVRTFRLTTSRMAFDAITRGLHGVGEAAFDLSTVRRLEGPLWRLVSERPPHLLDPAFASWEAFLLAAVDRTLGDLTAGGRPLAERTWGETNTADIAHPLAGAAPWLARFLSMPPAPLPGDTYVPRVLTPRSGASQRLVVSPGHEARGILHMPGGQSGHPLSPHFGDQQNAWIDGTPTPLLPGEARRTLTLVP